MIAESTTAIPLQRATAPATTRFRLHRAGIRNVWQYDEQEFAFGDGRLLLRGKNGAGKSKALEMLLPYLLDGDSRALDATGTGRTTLVWLMLDGFEQTNRLGYLWVEFRRPSEDEGGYRYLTLGAAIRASKSTNRAVPAFFVTPFRVGEDLQLVEGAAPCPWTNSRTGSAKRTSPNGPWTTALASPASCSVSPTSPASATSPSSSTGCVGPPSATVSNPAVSPAC